MHIALLEDKTKFPNYALMKISTYHKNKGDNVSFFEPIFSFEYDKVYYSKIFTWTPEKYITRNVEKGGTGFDIHKNLPDEIDNCKCDYSLYPDIDYAIGFLTRGCIRNCSWCVVPKKEGMIRPYRTVEEVARGDSNKIVLMDNNVLACDYGISEIEKLSSLPYYVDFNQGLDARLITPEVAKLLAKVKWIKYIRVSCDTMPALKYVINAYENLLSAGYKKEIFCYVLGKDESVLNILNELKKYKKITPFLQPYRDITGKVQVPRVLKVMAWWCNLHSPFKKYTFAEYCNYKGFSIS